MLKATKSPYYLDYIDQNIHNLRNLAEFGWDTKDAGINVLLSKVYNSNFLLVCFHLSIFYSMVKFVFWLMIL